MLNDPNELYYKNLDVFENIHPANTRKLDTEGMPIYRADDNFIKSKWYFLPGIKGVLVK